MQNIAKILVFIFIFNKLCYVQTLKNESSLCSSANCIMKCCPLQKYLAIARKYNEKTLILCDYYDNTTEDFDTLAKKVFINYSDIKKLNFDTKAGIFEANETFKMQAVNVANKDIMKLHLFEYPEIYLELPHAYHRWTRIPNDRFCWDHQIRRTKEGKTLAPGVWIVLPEDPEKQFNRNTSLFLVIVMLVSCIFLLAVLVVYAVLQMLRYLSGQILMAYVGNLFFAFLIFAIMHIQQHGLLTCHILTFLIYFFFLASFCWMNVMSFDIWWTFRRSATGPVFQRRGKNLTFLIYCLYGFGIPLAMTVALLILNEIDMSHMPWFVTPKLQYYECFISGGEKFLYLYAPMLVFMSCNWIFYLMTVVNVWRVSGETMVLDSTTAGRSRVRRIHGNRLLVYVKLSVVMGLSWVFEVISFLHPGYSAWMVTDFFNMSIGVTIFLVLVCNRNILRKLLQRWRPVQNDMESHSLSGVEEKELEMCKL